MQNTVCVVKNHTQEKKKIKVCLIVLKKKKKNQENDETSKDELQETTVNQTDKNRWKKELSNESLILFFLSTFILSVDACGVHFMRRKETKKKKMVMAADVLWKSI